MRATFFMVPIFIIVIGLLFLVMSAKNDDQAHDMGRFFSKLALYAAVMVVMLVGVVTGVSYILGLGEEWSWPGSLVIGGIAFGGLGYLAVIMGRDLRKTYMTDPDGEDT